MKKEMTGDALYDGVGFDGLPLPEDLDLDGMVSQRQLITRVMTDRYSENKKNWGGAYAEAHAQDYERVKKLDEHILARQQTLAAERTPEEQGLHLERATKGSPFAIDAKRYVEMNQAWRNLMRAGGDLNRIGDEERQIITGAAHSTDVDSRGAFTIDPSMNDRLIHQLSMAGGVSEVAWTLMTASGEPMAFPITSAAAMTGERVDIDGDADVSEKDITFGNRNLGGTLYGSGSIRVPRSLLEDSHFDIMSFISRQCLRNIGRIQNTDLTTGAGTTGIPLGVVQAAQSDVTSAVAGAVTYDELVDLVYSIDAAYIKGGEMMLGGLESENMGKICWMFHYKTEGALKKLKDSEGRPLFLPDIRSGTADMLFGYPYCINYDMAEIGAGAKAILFGNFSYYVIRRISSLRFQVLVETRAKRDQIEVLAFNRLDGQPVGPLDGSNESDAFKAITQRA